jgi:tripartite-type tricarboxylate transporter receptor subunit TctC
MVLAANPAFPAKSLKDLAKLAPPGGPKPFVAMPQTGSPPHVVALLIERAAGIDVTLVPYKAGPEAVAAAVAGDVPLVIEAPTAIAPQVRAGKLKALVVTGREREASLPDTPTGLESGFLDLQAEAWIGLVAPAGTPETDIALLHRALAQLLATPEMGAQMTSLGFRSFVTGPQDFRTLLMNDRRKWSALIQGAGIKLD